MANKTKNELLAEIEEINKKLYETEQDLIKYEQISACANMGEEYKLIYDNYLKAGFTKAEAFELLKITVDRTVTEFTRDIRSNYYRRGSYRRY